MEDTLFTEVVNYAFILSVGIGIRAIWVHNQKIGEISSKQESLLKKGEFYKEMRELENRIAGQINSLKDK